MARDAIDDRLVAGFAELCGSVQLRRLTLEVNNWRTVQVIGAYMQHKAIKHLFVKRYTCNFLQDMEHRRAFSSRGQFRDVGLAELASRI